MALFASLPAQAFVVAISPASRSLFLQVGAGSMIGENFRSGGAQGNNATVNSVSVTVSPASLSNSAGDTIAFSSISWVSGGIGDSAATVPSGTFAGGTRTLYSVGRNTWFESCLAFRYANAALVPSGTFTGRVTYTLTAP